MVDDATIREWARRNGYQVGERGRLQENVKEVYYREFPHLRPLANPNGTCQYCSNPMNDHRTWCTYHITEPVTVAEYVDSLPAEDVGQEVDDKAVQAPNAAPALNDAVGSLAAALAALTPNVELDEGKVREIAEEVANKVLADSKPPVYDILIGDGPVVHYDKATHAKFADVVKIVGAGLHAYLVGPPGTGKTTLCSQVAEALSLDFAMISCDPTMPASKLFGFVDANGTERRTPFWDVYENGGLFLFDEIDNAHPGIIAGMNSALANGHCAFASRIVKRHDSFRCVAAANTFGTGATRQFVGRNQLDAATLDRFVTVAVDIDEKLEEALTLGALSENVQLAKEWLANVRKWRKNAGDKGLQVIISPRASIEGARLLGVGFDMTTVADMKVWKGIDASTRAKIESGF
jgi:cobaltochelatase CobS